MTSTSLSDRAAIALSFGCVAHCVALPILAVLMPFLAAIAEAEWIHWTFAGLAIMASSSVPILSVSARRPAFLIPAGIGMALISFALFAEQANLDETPPTIIGGILIAFAHLRRLAKHG